MIFDQAAIPVIRRGPLVGLLLAIFTSAASAAQQDELGCTTDFEILAAHIMQNYAAYPIEIRGRRDAEFAELMTRVRWKADGATSTGSCIRALREFTAWFEDPHLFVTEYPEYGEEELATFLRMAERRPLPENHAIRSREPGSDPIEGIWYDESGEIVVVPDGEVGTERFVGVVLASSSEAWAPGDVRARIERIGVGDYRVVLFMDDRSPRHLEGALYKGGLLFRIAPHAWGRRAPVEPHDLGLLHPVDPRAPTLTIRDPAAVVISVPSHDPKYASVLDSLVRSHAIDLRNSRTLVIDLRGNEGGSSRTTNGLEGYYYSAEQTSPSRHVGPPVVLASPANRRAFERWTEWFDPDPAWLTNLLADLEERTGELVTYEPTAGDTDEAGSRPPAVHENPRQVAVLIDEGVVSAGEAFVLKVRRYDRVMVFGRPTMGSIDYQNVQLLPLAPASRGFFLGYPTQASTRNLPEDGFNRTGVEPDVRVDPGMVDPVAFVLAYLEGVADEGNSAATR